jgi:hypothetical protein
MKNPPAFKQIDVARALKAAKAAGFQVRRFEIHTDGKISVAVLADEGEKSPEDTNPSRLFDNWKASSSAAKN